MKHTAFGLVFAGLLSIAAADVFAEEVCYTPVRGSASTTNVSTVEQLGEYVILFKRSGYVADTPRFLRLKGALRGLITNPEAVTTDGALPLLDHVLRSGSDLLFTSGDTLDPSSIGFDPAEPCYLSGAETVYIVGGTGRFEGVTGQITVEGEIFNGQVPACLPEFIGSANEFEVVPAAGGFCFTVE